MFRALMLTLALAATAPAQRIVSPEWFHGFVTQLDSPQPGEKALACHVSPIKPSLNFGFRYQAGYTVSVPMSQFTGTGHGWAVFARIAPRSSTRQPVYLVSQLALPDVPKTKLEVSFGGGYQLGLGGYDVSWMMLDDSGRICRKTWRIDVHPGSGERQVKVAMPPDTVWEFGPRGRRSLSAAADGTRPFRLTIFLHAAPLSPRRTRLRPSDTMTLVSSVSSLMERLPASSVRLVVFNLEQQKELYRRGGFLLRDMPAVSQALNHVELGLVDLQVLGNKRGHVDLLANLVNRELESQPPIDLVVFLGPANRFSEGIPAAALAASAPGPPFFYFRIVPVARPDSEFGDTIHSAVSRRAGKTITIRTPGDFAKAIERLEKAVHAAL